jgi:hypothetical protein
MKSLAALALSAAVAAFACSGSSSNVGAGPTADQACGDSAHANCSHLQTCAPALVQIRYGDEGSCEARLKANCLNALAAPSQGNNPSKTEGCAQAYPSWACPDYVDNVNVPDACKQATGALAAGASCAFSGQCSTGFCAIAPGAACGMCAAQPSAGASCAQLTACGQGLVCTNDTQTCVVLGAAGAACGKGAPCGTGLSCVGADAATGAMGTCQPAVAMAGAACDPTLKMGAGCDRNAGLACNTTSKQCAALVVASGGQPCDFVNGQGTPCGASGTCSTSAAGMMGTCTAAAADGAACDVMNGPPCLNPARCVVAGGGTGGTCELSNASTCH